MKKIARIVIWFEDSTVSEWTPEKLEEALHLKEILRQIESLED